MDFPPFPPCFPRGFPAENLLFHVSFWSFPRRMLKSAWKVLKTARFFHEKEEFSAARRQRKEKLSHRGRAAARQRCREPDRKRSDVKDLAVVLHLLAGGQHILHGGVGVGISGALPGLPEGKSSNEPGTALSSETSPAKHTKSDAIVLPYKYFLLNSYFRKCYSCYTFFFH